MNCCLDNYVQLYCTCDLLKKVPRPVGAQKVNKSTLLQKDFNQEKSILQNSDFQLFQRSSHWCGKKRNLYKQLFGFHVSFLLCLPTCKTSDSCLHDFIWLLRTRLLRIIIRAMGAGCKLYSTLKIILFKAKKGTHEVLLGAMLVVIWIKHVFGCVVPQKVMALKFCCKELLPGQIRTTLVYMWSS